MSEFDGQILSKEVTSDNKKKMNAWADAISQIALFYRITHSRGVLYSITQWQSGLPLMSALTNLARQAGLSARLLDQLDLDVSLWRLPLVVELSDQRIAVITRFDGDDSVTLNFSDDSQQNVVSYHELLSEVRSVVSFRPLAKGKDSRVDAYVTAFKPDWLKRLLAHDWRTYGYVVLSSLIINILALSGILFSMQVYDRVIPAQSLPTLYVLYAGVILAVSFSFLLGLSRGHISDILGKRADLRVSERVFGHTLRLRESATPRSTGSFIAQLRELEQIREMVTSTTVTAVVDIPFFIFFIFVLFLISPQLAWVAPLAALFMIMPGFFLQRKMGELAKNSIHESVLRNAVLVESVQGLDDIKQLQAEERFLQQWNGYVRIISESNIRLRRLTQGLTTWGGAIQSLVYATVIFVGAPMVIDGDLTTGAIVAVSLLSSRMITPMTKLCGILARWQQLKAAKAGLDSILQLPIEIDNEQQCVHCPVLYGHYQFNHAVMQYTIHDPLAQLKINKLEIRPGERIALLGPNGAGKSALLRALSGGMTLVSGEVRLDNISLPHIDVYDVRRNVGFLTQNARLFHGTLRENLMLGAPHVNDEKLFEILEIVGAASFVRRLPLGIEHMVMEGGGGLSGGQRQSLLLARTLLRDPNIILLDEPSALLDENTEREFIKHFNKWLAGRTLIVTTHRRAILELVDRVIVLRDGMIALDERKDKIIK
ncbi:MULTISPECIES: type I secretion system permease/ATPase [Edwardsiella]|uniref:Type I secretion system ATPase, LssB family LapB n=2 Tax=Edwardsiella anguillarum TaxID=1821960 RepID=A0A076LSX4_9GAMM|nr:MULTISPECIES: type I secretion system permease/ATPase [Edwardsiella]AIJ09782.1 Type I secretion system ATPase, LssB family LapB [Edwardsiella anguillarum ET080813]AKR77482.1 type I secretion system permease/ATPase [Edwardsiella sp. LADL05-105]UOU80537.1 type I secretion system permease/ATPase [Edwardsiella anguillarum]WHP85282.1 type I secretion system permease/ATPase [Edwardsiella anguillarum]WHP89065.1 type I secretion system permease/ATPase [Edwardsiella anguillarum]